MITSKHESAKQSNKKVTHGSTRDQSVDVIKRSNDQRDRLDNSAK
nr:MAG: hypothetical protein [Apis mellifera filamentous virus]